MSKKLLLGIVVVLLITNIATLLFVGDGNDSEVVSDGEGEKEINRNEAVATVADEEISYDEWMTDLRNMQGQKYLKQMIDKEVVNTLAEQEGIEVSEKIIDREVSFLYTMQGILTEEDAAVEEERWREEIKYRYQLEQLLTRDIEIPEDEIKSYYDTYGNQYDFSSSVKLSHILVEDMETAEQVYQELEDGASFKLLAREYSIDDETRQNGGYMGAIYTSSQFLLDSYETQAANMENHTYSEPFQAENGVAIMYLHRKLPAIEFTYEEVQPYVHSEIAMHEEGLTLEADQLWEEVDIEWIYENK
ncbi:MULTISPECIES: peptidyl-prolyl cis-trans isomerase [Oceanobacillus]|uniref:peptidylprolyl isomerase n=1 Tax=Oceanobacillus kimchii TaxID=746691 RepID=A0ABQ5TCK3_9BACI|nr:MULTISPECIES: peptidyl-prolyl cis-trans isomerase [Oceanobacillus]MBT2599818.1 peptidylprolyl isomerase [Oceanobacillus sp. ISL-74]MBT2652732.1 peptidylprolyl isomerase [Oceanobacillus sp. ISL-73]MCT1577275.1 peptidylprolyl isomerase [Oceanobacillus kimchii]MCT2135345.1 peptidylprolyl isomerase [Oceanobacillus kimchii]OEH56608.1 protein secretion protein [Oceanobacillus sp. E9]